MAISTLKNKPSRMAACILAAVWSIVASANAYAQQPQPKTVEEMMAMFIGLSGEVYDAETNQPATGATVLLCDSTGTVISKVVAGQTSMDIAKMKKRAAAEGQSDGQGNLVKLDGGYGFNIPRKEATYIIKATKGEKYDTAYALVSIKHLGKRERGRKVPRINIYRKARKLDEVTVTSKVKFFYRGDTLVYNADAFNLPDGSMLEDLIKAVGAEINSNGIITHNGRVVEELLLNGKQFFNRHKQLVLESLGSYTVDQLKFYDKAGEASQLAGRKISGDTRYALDVKLKKEYSVGTIFNIEAGIGSDKRYIGRLFAMTFTDRARFTLIGNLNNLNNSSRPGESDIFNAPSIGNGVRHNKMGGFDYRIEQTGKPWTLEGETTCSHYDSNNRSETRALSFMPQGNTFRQSYSSSDSKQLDISSSHTLMVHNNSTTTRISPNFSFKRYNYHGATDAATFDRELTDGVSRDDILNLLEGRPGNLREALINRALTRYSGNNRESTLGGDVQVMFKVPKTPDIITLTTDMTYHNMSSDDYDDYNIAYGDNQPSTHRLQHSRTKPSHDLRYSARLQYSPFIYRGNAPLNLVMSYTYRHEQKHEATELALLRERSEREMIYGAIAYGEPEYDISIDPENTHTTKTRNDTHMLNVAYTHSFAPGASISSGVTVGINDESLHFAREALDTTVTRTNFIFTPNVRASYRNTVFTYEYRKQFAPLMSYVDTRNTSDPLSITISNPQLRNASTHSMRLMLPPINIRKGNTVMLHQFAITSDIRPDAIVNGYSFDQSTGIRYYKRFNVDGTWNLGPSYEMKMLFGHTHQFELKNSTNYTYGHDVDMVGFEGDAIQKSIINNNYLRENLSLSMSMGQQSITAKAAATMRHASSRRDNFKNLTMADVNYGLTGSFKLPFGLSASTDITLYSRYGYGNKELNTTDLVWNARLSRTFIKGKLLVMIDGFDILHQLSNVHCNINAQGRSEYYTNVLPSYVMLHAQLRLNHQPRKLKTIANP